MQKLFKYLYLLFVGLAKLLIAGIDPGAVKAYAVLDIEGNVLDIGSGRTLKHEEITLKIIEHGKVFMVGSDVRVPNSAVEKIACKIGARVVAPDHDLRHSEKIKIVDSFLKTKKEFVDIKNRHEKDALAAALYGFKKIRVLVKKIDDYLVQHNKTHLAETVKRKVLVENSTISDAVRILS